MGIIVSSTSYDSFGNATSNIATTYRYTGREYDSDTGLYYYRNRWYDPEVGLFISEDPIGFAGGDVNLYRYVWNNPQNFVDPYGEGPFLALLLRLFSAGASAGAYVMMNPSYVNAPAPCKPVIRASDEVSVGGILGAAAGMAGGPILGKVAGAVLRGAAGAISKGLGAAGRGIQKAAKGLNRGTTGSGSAATWNQFQKMTAGQFASRAEAGAAWSAYKQTNRIVTGVFRSQAQKSLFLRNAASSGMYPKWMNQWLRQGKVPPGYHVDHIKPLSIGGKDVPSNMRLLDIDFHINIHHKYYRPWQ